MIAGAPDNKMAEVNHKELSQETQDAKAVAYHRYNQSETKVCQNPTCGKSFIVVNRKRNGKVADKQAGARRKYCYECAPPKNCITRSDLGNWEVVDVPLRRTNGRDLD
jgi:hypothetical protein